MAVVVVLVSTASARAAALPSATMKAPRLVSAASQISMRAPRRLERRVYHVTGRASSRPSSRFLYEEVRSFGDEDAPRALARGVAGPLPRPTHGSRLGSPQRAARRATATFFAPAYDASAFGQRAAAPSRRATTGVALANIMFLSPVKAVVDARKCGRLNDLNAVPFVAIVGNTVAWLGYSFATRDAFVFLANWPGLLLGLYYTMTGVALGDQKQRSLIEKLLLAYAAVLGAAGYAAASGAFGSAQAVLGLVANALLLLYYSSPLSVVANVVKKRNAAALFWPLSLTSLLNGALWTSYGRAVGDAYIWAPNLVGALLATHQLALIGAFGQKAGADERAAPEASACR